MPRNGSGQYILPPGVNPVQGGTIITTNWGNTTLDDIATALSTSISTDGQTPPTANLPMGGLAHTNVADAVQSNQYAAAGQVQRGQFNLITSVTNNPARTQYTGTLPFIVTTIPANMLALFIPTADNAGPVALAINPPGGLPLLILNPDGSTLAANQLKAGRPYTLVFTGPNWTLHTNTLTAASLAGLYLPISGGTLTGPLTLSQSPPVGPLPPLDPGLLMAATKTYVDTAVSGSVAGVATVNARAGSVVLTPSDITGGAGATSPGSGLNYVPANLAGGLATAGQGGWFTGPIQGTDATFQRARVNNLDLTVTTMSPSTGTVTVQAAQAQNFWVSMTGPITLVIDPSGPLGGNLVGNIIRFQFVNTVGKTITWPAGVQWPLPLQTPPVIDSGANKILIVTMTFGGGATWFANASIY